jgi:hypothetical protein
VKIGKNRVRINQDFSVVFRKQTYSRQQVTIRRSYKQILTRAFCFFQAELLNTNNKFFNIAITGNYISIASMDRIVTVSQGSRNNIRVEVDKHTYQKAQI